MDKNIIPTVTVLMPAYNAQMHIKEAIDSILNQTFNNFEFVIINDGSTDATEKIIQSFNDGRIRYFKNETNLGLIYTLNKGLDLIQSDYLIRMDADDIAMAERIDKQIAFMENNPEVIVSGTQVEYFGNVNKKSDFPLDHNFIKTGLLFSNTLVHPSTILRLSKIKENKLTYNADFKHIEDYEFWLNASKYGQLANMKDYLLKYRMEGQNITINNWNSRETGLKKIYSKLLNNLAIPPTEQNLKLHIELSGNSESISSITKLKSYTQQLINQNKIKKQYLEQALKEALNNLWEQLFFKVVLNGLGEVLKYSWHVKSISIKQIRFLLGYYKHKFF